MAASRAVLPARSSLPRAVTRVPASRSVRLYAVTLIPGLMPRPTNPAESVPNHAWSPVRSLIRPESRGTNTPLKIYQYLRSGKPIVATRLLTHTQVLSDDTAILTGPTAAEFAAGVLAGLRDLDRAARVGRQALALAETKYSYETYLDRTRQACAALLPANPAGVVAKDVA